MGFSRGRRKIFKRDFSSVSKAEEWIKKHKLSGVLTAYPLNDGVYDWAISHDFLVFKKKIKKNLHLFRNLHVQAKNITTTKMP